MKYRLVEYKSDTKIWWRIESKAGGLFSFLFKWSTLNTPSDFDTVYDSKREAVDALETLRLYGGCKPPIEKVLDV